MQTWMNDKKTPLLTEFAKHAFYSAVSKNCSTFCEGHTKKSVNYLRNYAVKLGCFRWRIRLSPPEWECFMGLHNSPTTYDVEICWNNANILRTQSWRQSWSHDVPMEIYHTNPYCSMFHPQGVPDGILCKARLPSEYSYLIGLFASI